MAFCGLTSGKKAIGRCFHALARATIGDDHAHRPPEQQAANGGISLPVYVIAASRITAATRSGCESITAWDAPSISVTVEPARS